MRFAPFSILKKGIHSRPRETAVVAFLLVFFFLMCLSSMALKTRTYDESNHYRYGKRLLEGNPKRFDDSKMPFSALNVLVGRAIERSIEGLPFGSRIMGKLASVAGMPPEDEKFRQYVTLQSARVGTILAALVLAFYVYRWSTILYGFAGGVGSLLLLVFCPNMIAHAQLVTSDLYAAAMVTISLYYYWRFLKSPGIKSASWSAVTLGLAQLAKYTCVFLYPIFAVIAVIRLWNPPAPAGNPAAGLRPRKRALIAGGYLAFFLSVSILIINGGFLFYESFRPLSAHRLGSEIIRKMQHMPVVRSIPVPLPYPYFQGLDWLGEKETFNSGCTNYLLGELRKGYTSRDAFKGYYLVASFFKVPIASQIFLVLTLIYYIRKRKEHAFREDSQFLLVPLLFFTVYFNVFHKTQIGLRYFLVAFPLAMIVCGSFFRDWAFYRRKTRIVCGMLMAWLIVSSLSYYPHYLSYFNEFVWDRTKGYQILADSNVDWGQDGWYLRRWKKTHPDAYILPPEPVAGIIVVPVNHLVGLFDPGQYRWLREGFEPAGQIAYSYLVYHVEEEQLRRVLDQMRKTGE